MVQDFVNTLDIEAGTDDLAGWMAARGAKLTAAETARLVDIREGLRALLEANNGAPAPAAAVKRLNAALARTDLTLRLGPEEEAGLEGGGGIGRAVAEIGQAVLRAQADGSWERLKACRDEECRWVFYDSSRNRSGTWCDMGLCGSRTKVRAYRQRQSG